MKQKRGKKNKQEGRNQTMQQDQSQETPVTPAETPDITPDTTEAAEAAEAAETSQPAEDVQDKLQAQLDKALKQCDEYLTLAQRVQADFDNFRRRNTSVRAEAFDDGAREFIKTLLPVVDNLERALSQGSTDESFLTGVRMTHKQLLDALQKRGVASIERQGELFDPKLENCILQGTTDEGEPGTVCQVLQKGYRLGDTVLRHALVKVVSE